MPVIHLEPLPPRTTKSEIVALLCGAGGLDRRQVGRIDLRGKQATCEVPDGWELRLVKKLDGSMFGDGRVRAWCRAAEKATDAAGHFQRLARLLELEARAESRQAAERTARLSAAEAERTGTSLVDLVVVDEFSGLGGRFMIRLRKRNRSMALPWTRLGTGSPVLVSPGSSDQPGVRGVVSERTADSLLVALNEPISDDDVPTWRVDLAGDEVARLRQRNALDRAAGARAERLAELRDVLLGDRDPEFAPPVAVTPLDRSLNESQVEAVRFALSSRDVALIHGPPGTGKTTAVVELIRQAVRRRERVLVCAPSNLGVDNILERLVAVGERVVRLGHPARVLPELRAHSLDLLVEKHNDVELSRKLVREALALFRQARKFTRAKPEPGARQGMRAEAKAMLADARRLENQAVESVLNSADILCGTTTGLDSEVLGQRQFELVVIDEACQSTEPGCWIPLLRSNRVVLAGDHCQLPPTIVSPEAAQQGFGTSMFERIMGELGAKVARRLNVQYRMHESIMEFPSLEFYDAELIADQSVRAHCLADLPDVIDTPLTQTPVQFIDTAGAGYDEELEADGESRFNRAEAELVCRKARELTQTGVAASDLAIISPYAAQVRLIRQMLDQPSVEVDSVDGFQGREKEAILISLVRSNVRAEIGFLADIRRMNVAMTRARRKLIVIGDSATLANHPFYHRLLEFFEQCSAYATVWEEEMST